jgi:hypothetical protein
MIFTTRGEFVKSSNDTNIFKKLREDHDLQREYLETLISTEGDSERRKKNYSKLKECLQDHAKYEERYFYAPLMEDDITVEASRHAVHEHYKIDKLIDEIDKTDFSSPQWLIKLKNLKHLVEHHLDEEEHEFFQLAGKALSEKQKVNLAKQYEKSMSA